MNCSIFHHKINDLIEDDCLIDFKNSMEQHRDNCKGCKAYYEEELQIHKDLKGFFSVKDIEFKSSRAEIINGINKNQYKNNYLIKLYTHFNRNKRKYSLWAAVFAIIFILTPKLSKLFAADKISFALSKSTSNSTASIKNASSSDKSNGLAIPNEAGEDLKEATNINFNKAILNGTEKITSINTWKESGDGKYSATIEKETRGIYVKDNKTGEIYSYTISNNSNSQSAPIFLEWSQKKDELLLLIGKKAGTIADSGAIYMLELDSSLAKLIYKPAEKQKVKSFKGLNGGLNVEIIVYEDSSFANYHIENINIPSE